jgi:hypothetical protein
MDLIFEIYKIISILSLSIYVLGYISLKRCILCEKGKYSLLDFSMLNCFSILSMYMDMKNLSNIFYLSLYIFILTIYVASLISFMEKFLDTQIFTNLSKVMLFPINNMSSTYNHKAHPYFL